MPQLSDEVLSAVRDHLLERWDQDAIIQRFNAAVADVLRQENVAKQITESQQVTLVNGGPEVLRKFVHDQMALWGPVAQENHIVAE